MEIGELFTEEIIKNIKRDIEDSSGQEVYLVANIDSDLNKVTEYKLMARGNHHMVPAIISDLKPGNIIIHNHPSGDLTPSAADIRLASRTGNNGIGFIIINNKVSRAYVVVEPKQPEEEKLLNEQEIVSLIKPGGEIEKQLKGYEYRKQQLDVVEKIIESFNKNLHMFIEAGTGTGKSFAYLIPALYWSNINKQVVVISTNTINLQEQLLNKDLVLLKKALPFNFKAVLVKGRSNYLCKRKLKNLEKRASEIFVEDPEKEIEFIKILNWVEDTESGTRSDLDFIIETDLWEEVASESELCLRTKCPYFDSCFFMKARKEVYSADILIVNHHLLISDAIVKSESGDSENGVLPKYKNLIIDEAHNFNDVSTKHLGRPFYLKVLDKYINRIYNKKYSLLPRLRNSISSLEIKNKRDILNIFDNKITPQIQRIIDLSKEFSRELGNFIEGNEDNVLRLTESKVNTNDWKDVQVAGNDLAGYLNNLGLYLNQLYEEIINLDQGIINSLEDLLIELEAALLKCQQLINNLDFNLKAEDGDFVFWIERNTDQVKQKNAPLDVSKILEDLLWVKIDTLVLTSATLTVNNSFDFFKSELGLEKSNHFQVESPFNYDKQAKVLIPKNIPPANSPEFLEKIINELKKALLFYGGKTMVLFTSYKMLNYCDRKLKPTLSEAGLTLLSQGRYPRKYIIDNFKINNNQIIFGTSSFWEGVDLKGDDLKYLIIMKLPFPVPSEPVAAARMEEMKKAGKNPFINYSLPRAVIRFKQGFGRLIRSRQDEGIIIVFDNRIITKSYGSIFLNSLPSNCPVEKINIKSIYDQTGGEIVG